MAGSRKELVELTELVDTTSAAYGMEVSVRLEASSFTKVVRILSVNNVRGLISFRLDTVSVAFAFVFAFVDYRFIGIIYRAIFKSRH